MNNPILFTPQDLFNTILAICGAISVIAGAAAVIIKIVMTAKRPNKIQNEKIAVLEDEIEKIKAEIKENEKRRKEDFKNNNEHITAAEEANAVTQRALLALLSHAINGNDIDSLRRAKSDLENYLTHNKKG